MPKITLAGTGGMLPMKNRWLTSCYIEHNGRAILIDCGEGTQIALSQCGVKISRIDVILLTHIHADHVTGLPGLLLSIGNCSRTEPLDIFVPQGEKTAVEKLMYICGMLTYEVRVHELSVTEQSAFEIGGDGMTEVMSIPLRHSVNCLGYSIRYKRRPVFQPEKAQALGIPIKFWKTLHGGESVELDDGRIFTPEEVTENSRRDIKITYVTDTLPFDGISDFAKGSDLFICEGMYGDLSQKESMDKKGHMLMQDACRLAKNAEVKQLWLTHYSPAMTDPQEYADTLSEIFGSTTISSDGETAVL